MTRRLSSVLWTMGLLVVTGCDGSDNGGEGFPGCGSDVDCKGDRVCVNEQCVDPEDADEAGGGVSGSAGRAGSSGSAGEGGSSGNGDESGGSGGMGNGGSESGGSGGASGNIEAKDAALEAACIADCDAMLEAECEETVPTNDQCVASCLLLDASLRGYCFEEHENYYACKAAGGYECLNGRALPHSSCVEEQAARTDCLAAVPCREYCQTALEEACAEDEAACVEACLDERRLLDTSCAHDYDGLLMCWADRLSCEQGRPSMLSCEEELAETAWCIGVHDEDCKGFCWGAKIVDCGSEQCLDDCRARIGHNYCGTYYRQALNCVLSLSEFNMTCRDGTPVPSGSCADEEQNYQECLQTHDEV